MVMVVWMMVTFATPAAGKTINLIVDDPSHLTVMVVGEYDSTPLIFGDDNSAQLTFQADVPVIANSGWEIVSITTASGNSATASSLPASNAEITASMVQDGETVYIVTGKKSVKTFTIEVDNPQHIESVSYNYLWITPVSDGIWEVEITDNYTPIYINLKPDYKVVSFKDSFGNELSYSNNRPTIVGGSYNENAVFYVSTKSKEEDRTSSLNINFEGNPDDVVLKRAGNSVITLVRGSQTVFFDPETEVPFSLSHIMEGRSVYQVELNGEKVKKNEDGHYVFDPTNGGELDITVDYPDVNVPVHISYASADLAGIISSVQIDGQMIDSSEWSSSDFAVKAGSTLEINLDYSHFANPGFTVNGVETRMPLFIEVENEYDIVISAQVIPNNNITIYCGQWENLEIYAGSEIFELTGEETIIEVSGNINYIQFKPLNNYVIEGVYDLSTNKPYELVNGYLYNIADGMKLDVELELYERNETAIVYLEDADWDMVMLRMGHVDVMCEINLQPGYNTVKFNKDDLPFMVSGYTYQDGAYLSPEVYFNGNLCTALYGAYEELNNVVTNDVISIYSRKVDPFNVTVEIEDGIEAEIVKNLVQPVEETTFAALPGTLVQVKGTSIAVKANGQNVQPDENGIFNVSVIDNTDIVISQDTNTSVEGVETSETVDVYNLQGVLVRSGISSEDVKTLPAGIYVVGGKKIIVK